MRFFAARVVRHPAMQNPTLVALTDRNDQLFSQFQRCADILGQSPVQASEVAVLTGFRCPTVGYFQAKRPL